MEQDIPKKGRDKSKRKGKGRGVGALGSEPTGAAQEVTSSEAQGSAQGATAVLEASGAAQDITAGLAVHETIQSVTAGSAARGAIQGVTAGLEASGALQGASSLESHGPAQGKKGKGKGRGRGIVQMTSELHGTSHGSLTAEFHDAAQGYEGIESCGTLQGATSLEAHGQAQGKKSKKKGQGRGKGAMTSESSGETLVTTTSEPHGTVKRSALGKPSIEQQAAAQIPLVVSPPTETNQPASAGNKKGKKKKSQKGKAAGGAEDLPGAMAELKVDKSSVPSDKGPMSKPEDREAVIRKILSTRPNPNSSKVGKNGRKIVLTTNFYELSKTRDWRLCLYHVYYSPEEERTREKKSLLRQHHKFLGDGYLFDGMQLYLNRLIGNTNSITELTSRDQVTQTDYTIKIKFIKELEGNDVLFLQLMNIILRRCQDHLGLRLLGRNFYNPALAIQEGQYDVTILPGYSTSIREFERSIMLNIDVSHKFIRNETALEFINKQGGNDQVQAAILGIVVITRYNEKTYRVDDIDFNRNPSSTFPYHGENKSYIDYYQQRYNLTINNVRQPLLMSRPKKRDIRRGMTENIYLIPELCKVTGLSDGMRNDFRFMKSLAQYTRMTPDSRVLALKDFNTSLTTNERTRKELSQWGLNMERNLVQIEGRVLPRITLIQNGELDYQQHSADWSREMRERRLNNPKEMINWAVVYPKYCENDAKDLCGILQRVGGRMGMNISKPLPIPMRDDNTNTYIQNLQTCAGKQIILVLLSKNFGDRYAAIKKHLSVTMAIPSQCVLSRTLQNKTRLMSVATKIAIQMNCKLGGDVWKVEVPKRKIMIIGYDTYHDTKLRGSSFGAVVSTINTDWTRYFGQVARHANQEELTDKFGTAVAIALSQFQEENKCFPEFVFVYRDGVGDGQVGYVKEHEVAAIQKCFDRINIKNQKWTFIIVSKRINTRIFGGSINRITNPPPGTIVDDVITLPERYDFFLVPQSVNQGTVTPTSFNVIHDTTGLSPDLMQDMAYKLTHLYYNWQGAVRVPAPCLYAHKLAYMTGTAIHEPPHSNIANKLWYL